MDINKLYYGKIIQTVCIDVPIFLLIFNFVLYSVFEIENYKNILRIIAFSLFLIGWLINGVYKVTLEQFITFFLITMLLLVQGTSALNFLAVFIFAFSTSINLKKLVKKIFLTNIFFSLIIMSCIYLSIISTNSYVDSVGRMRNAMGFLNPNAGAIFYSSLIYLYILSKDKIRIRDYVLGFSLNVYIFSFTDSRTAFLSLTLFLLLIPILNKTINIYVTKISILLLNDVIWLAGIISLFTINLLSNFDAVLSNRISNYIQVVDQFTFLTFFFGGGELQEITIDNFYLVFLYQSGIFIYLLTMYLVHKKTKILIECRETRILAFVISIFLMGLTESSFIRPEIPITLILWKVLLGSNSLNAIEKISSRR